MFATIYLPNEILQATLGQWDSFPDQGKRINIQDIASMFPTKLIKVGPTIDETFATVGPYGRKTNAANNNKYWLTATGAWIKVDFEKNCLIVNGSRPNVKCLIPVWDIENTRYSWKIFHDDGSHVLNGKLEPWFNFEDIDFIKQLHDAVKARDKTLVESMLYDDSNEFGDHGPVVTTLSSNLFDTAQSWLDQIRHLHQL